MRDFSPVNGVLPLLVRVIIRRKFKRENVNFSGRSCAEVVFSIKPVVLWMTVKEN